MARRSRFHSVREAVKPPSEFTNLEDFLTNLKNPRWNDAAQTSVMFDGVYDGDRTTFLATANDPEEYGHEVYNNARAGVYGPIGPYKPPTPTKDELEEYATVAQADLLTKARDYEVTGVGTISCAVGVEQGNLDHLCLWGTNNPTATSSWTDDAYETWTLTGKQAVGLWNATFVYQQTVKAAFAQVAKDIASGKITSYAQIDKAPWPKGN